MAGATIKTKAELHVFLDKCSDLANSSKDTREWAFGFSIKAVDTLGGAIQFNGEFGQTERHWYLTLNDSNDHPDFIDIKLPLNAMLAPNALANLVAASLLLEGFTP